VINSGLAARLYSQFAIGGKGKRVRDQTIGVGRIQLVVATVS
jgi:hypothetical protein